MRELLIYGTYSVGITGMLFFGLLMLVAPQRSINLRDRMIKADRWSRPNPDWKSGYYLELRFAGLVLTVMALLMIRPVLRVFLGSSSGHPTEPGRPGTPTTDIGPDWFALGVGLVMILGGVYNLVRPEPLLRWAATRLPHRVFTDEAVLKGRPGVRIMGAVAVVAGAFAIYAWLRSIVLGR